jgi:hypothetical protein
MFAISANKTSQLCNLLVGPVGLEPTTNGLRGHCSTIELQTQASSKPKVSQPVLSFIPDLRDMVKTLKMIRGKQYIARLSDPLLMQVRVWG